MSQKDLGQMTLEERYEYYKSILEDMTIFHDIFMKNVFTKIECVEYVLQVIMNKKDLKVKSRHVQVDYKNLRGRSTIMDCVATDDSGKKYNIEIQRASQKATPERARYYSSMLDSNSLNTGDDFEQLPESYVIFITEKDVLGYDKPIYHIKRVIEEVDEDFRDRSHIIYVDSSKQDDTELGMLMQDLHCKNPKDFHSKILGERVFELKETTEGAKIMCKEMNDIYTAGAISGKVDGIAMGEQKKAKAFARKLYERGDSIDDISELVDVSVKTVREWLGLQAV